MPRFEDLAAEGQALVEVGGAVVGVDVATQAELDAHATDTTDVHGIADTAALATQTYVDTAVGNATSGPVTAWRASGATGNYIATPDKASLTPTTSLDLRVAVALDDWTPAADQPLMSKYGGAGQRSWALLVRPSSALRLIQSANGTDLVVADSTSTVTATDGELVLVRALWDAATPSVQFFTKPTTRAAAKADSASDTGWTQLGSTITAGAAASIFDGTAAAEIGGYTSGGVVATGNFSAAHIKGGCTTAAEWDGRAPMTRYVDSTRGVWTVNGTANGWVT